MRWAVFISGTGSNLGALIDLNGDLDIRLVVSSRNNAPGILKAKRAGIPIKILDSKVNWSELLSELEKFRIEAIFLAGFMKIIPPEFISKFKGQILNLHPSLLPAYPGLKSIEKAHADRAPLGCTVHRVVAEVDSGEILAQRSSRYFDDLKLTEFAMHIEEQKLIRQAVLRC